MLVADFREPAKRTGRLIAGNPIHAFDFTDSLAKDIVLADYDAVLMRINRENIKRLAGGETETLALADRKIMDAIVMADDIAAFIDDFSLRALQRDSTLARIRVDKLHIVSGGHEA